MVSVFDGYPLRRYHLALLHGTIKQRDSQTFDLQYDKQWRSSQQQLSVDCDTTPPDHHIANLLGWPDSKLSLDFAVHARCCCHWAVMLEVRQE